MSYIEGDPRSEQEIIAADRGVGRQVMRQFRALPEWYRDYLSRPSREQILASQQNEEARLARESLERIVAQLHGAVKA